MLRYVALTAGWLWWRPTQRFCCRSGPKKSDSEYMLCHAVSMWIVICNTLRLRSIFNSWMMRRRTCLCVCLLVLLLTATRSTGLWRRRSSLQWQGWWSSSSSMAWSAQLNGYISNRNGLRTFSFVCHINLSWVWKCMYVGFIKGNFCFLLSTYTLSAQEDGWYFSEDMKEIETELQNKQQKLDQEWLWDAYSGQPTGSSRPSAKSPYVVTPTPTLLVDRFDLDLPSAEKVPEPCKKAALTAAKRLEKELKLKAHGAKPKAKAEKKAEENKETETEVSKTKGKTSKQKKPSQEDKKGGKKKMDGPMTSAMKAFIELKISEGHTYFEARGLWKTSADRQAIVDGMSEAEAKRRRYKWLFWTLQPGKNISLFQCDACWKLFVLVATVHGCIVFRSLWFVKRCYHLWQSTVLHRYPSSGQGSLNHSFIQEMNWYLARRSFNIFCWKHPKAWMVFLYSFGRSCALVVSGVCGKLQSNHIRDYSCVCCANLVWEWSRSQGFAKLYFVLDCSGCAISEPQNQTCLVCIVWDCGDCLFSSWLLLGRLWQWRSRCAPILAMVTTDWFMLGSKNHWTVFNTSVQSSSKKKCTFLSMCIRPKLFFSRGLWGDEILTTSCGADMPSTDIWRSSWERVHCIPRGMRGGGKPHGWGEAVSSSCCSQRCFLLALIVNPMFSHTWDLRLVAIPWSSNDNILPWLLRFATTRCWTCWPQLDFWLVFKEWLVTNFGI